jgi:uncharacterized protein (TIGR00255 family)
MITSMTGFGSGQAESQGARVTVELRSVNSRFCEVQVRCPAGMQGLEGAIKERVQTRVPRGKITVQVIWEEEGETGELPVLDEGVVRRYLRELARLAELARPTLGVAAVPDLGCLARLPGLFRLESMSLDRGQAEGLVLTALEAGLDDFVRMRAVEGEALSRDLRGRVERIADLLRRVEVLVAASRERLRERLRDKVNALLAPGAIPEDRLAAEVVLLAERSDVTEEIVRFQSHNAQFLETLERGGEVGRRFTFLLQEMNREANTINSKADETEVVHLVVEIKEDLERLREQVQNLA